MNHNRIAQHRGVAVVLAGVLSVLLVGTALAALPTAGKHYAGFTSGQAYNGFKPPVSFKVSSDRTRLLGFTYSASDCGGMGGPGDPWPSPWLVRKIATVKIDRNGHFFIKNAAWKATRPGSDPPVTKYSYSTVNGRFTTRRKATGTITLKVKIDSSSCPVQKLSFTAKTS